MNASPPWVFAVAACGGFVSAALLSFLLTPLFSALGRRTGLLDRPSGRKTHLEPTPFLGGAAVFASFWTVIGAGLILGRMSPDLPVPQAMEPLMRGVSVLVRESGTIFIGALIIFALGLLDDVFDVFWAVKLGGQAVAGVLIISMGYTINFFEPFGWLGYAGTLCWILLVINAFNFIDSIDGHCAGIALVSATFFFFVALILNQPMIAAFAAVLAGVLAGFLPHNFRPAKIFLGDNGSLLVGYLLAAVTLLCNYSVTDRNTVTLLIPLLMFGVPIYDTVSVVTVRLIRGKAPWKGDRNHFAHRLCRMGMGVKAAVTFSYFVAITLGLIAVLSTQIDTPLGTFVLIALFACVILIIALLEYYSSLRARIAEDLQKRNLRRRDDIRDEEDRRL